MPASLTTSARAFCWASSLAALAACTDNPRVIVAVDVLDHSARADKRELEQAALKIARDLPGCTLRKTKEGEIGWQLTVDVAMLVERPALDEDAGTVLEGQMHRGLGIGLTLASLSGQPIRFEGGAILERNVPKDSPVGPLALELLHEASRSLGGSLKLADANDKDVIAALGGTDGGLRKKAVAMAGERKLKAAVPKLTEILSGGSEDHDLVLKAIGALVAIGDDSAVEALIEAGKQRTPAYLNQILFAVGSLGGKKAEAWLFTVSRGHPDAEVRKNASDALAELESRKEARERDSARQPE